MRVAGIVAEYNPFHNGHSFMADQARQSGATHLVACMSGSFVQRGEAAFADKFLRAEAAVRSGVDLVLDLPVPWSLGGASSFARGGVSILSSIGCDALAFGCETNDETLLLKTAQTMLQDSVQAETAALMKEGLTYPAALGQVLSSRGLQECADVLASPNNVLAVEYIKSILQMDLNMSLIPVKRVGSGHDATVCCGKIASAAALRAMNESADMAPYMPAEAFRVYRENPGRMLSRESFETSVLTALRLLPEDAFVTFVEDRSGLADRLRAAVKTSNSLDSLYQAAKTKNYTLSKVRRETMHLYLHIPTFYLMQEPLFVRVLAANDRGLEVLSKADSRIPILTKHAESLSLSREAKALYDLQCRASDLYSLCTKEKRACCTEQTSSIQIIRSVPQ